MIVGFAPTRGPYAGGTQVKISGQDLDAGSNVTVIVASIPCTVLKRESASIICETGQAPSEKMGGITVKIDNAERQFAKQQFQYQTDPSVGQISSTKTIVSGGVAVRVRGERFDLLQRPQIYVSYSNENYDGPCTIVSDSELLCYTPKLPAEIAASQYDPERPMSYPLGFQLDGKEVMWKDNAEVYQDPQFQSFPGDGIRYYKADEYVTIHGSNIAYALDEDDIVVWVGRDRCNVTALAMTAITCRAPAVQPAPQDDQSTTPEVVVSVGAGRRNYTVGFLSYSTSQTISWTIIIAISIVVALCAIVVVSCFIAIYRRKATKHARQMKQLQEQITAIELKVAAECKDAFAELQTGMGMTGGTADMALGIPFLAYRDYVLRVLFPSNPCPPGGNPLEEISQERRAILDRGLRAFNQLLMNKNFLLCFIRTLEGNKYFLGKDRVYVG